jgi:very-short-patch-repair endonuclease
MRRRRRGAAHAPDMNLPASGGDPDDWTSCLGCAPVMRERDAATTLGVSRRKVQTLIAEGVIAQPRRGVVVGACLVERASSDRRLAHLIMLRTLLLTYDDCVASHESAALLLGLPLLNLPPYAIGTRPRGAWRGGPTSRVRIARLPLHHLTVAQRERCTTVARTFVDIARSGSFREAVVVGDAVLRDNCSLADLIHVLEECSAWADLGKARVALRFLDARSESPLESVSRAIIYERELPPPEPQFVIDAGAATYRLDFYWKDERVVGEADGMSKYDDPEVLRAEKVRQERLERLGLTVVRWNWHEMLVDTDETIARLRHHLTR